MAEQTGYLGMRACYSDEDAHSFPSIPPVFLQALCGTGQGRYTSGETLGATRRYVRPEVTRCGRPVQCNGPGHVGSQQRHSRPRLRSFRMKLACRCTNIAVRAVAEHSSGSVVCQTRMWISGARLARRQLSSDYFPRLRPEVAPLVAATRDVLLEGDSPGRSAGFCLN